MSTDTDVVLIGAGDKLDRLITGALARGIYVRDRSSEPGCAGQLRVAAGAPSRHLNQRGREGSWIIGL